MICVECLEPTAAAPCTSCGAVPLLDGRYALLARVGRGSAGVVYRGVHVESGDAVALKQVLVGHLEQGKARALAAREGAVLRQLVHPGIPRWREEVLVGRGRGAALFLVQDFVEGEDLQTGLPTHRWTEGEALRLAAEVLDILAYLHGLHPPIIHRDVKPANLIRRADGRIALVDFGSVREAFSDAAGGSTVAGTFGYMAPEQFAGDAGPASDLYALGVTLVTLLGRRPPTALLQDDGSFRWRDAVRLSAGCTGFLADLLAPSPEARPDSAARAAARARALLARAPAGSGVAAAAEAVAMVGLPQSPTHRATGGDGQPGAPAVGVAEPLATQSASTGASAGAAQALAPLAPAQPAASTWGDEAPRALAPLRPVLLRFLSVSLMVWILLYVASKILYPAYRTYQQQVGTEAAVQVQAYLDAMGTTTFAHPASLERTSLCSRLADPGALRAAASHQQVARAEAVPFPLTDAEPGTTCGAAVYYSADGVAREAVISGRACPFPAREAACRAVLGLTIPAGEALPVRWSQHGWSVNAPADAIVIDRPAG